MIKIPKEEGKFKSYSSNGRVRKRATPGSAGFVLYSAVERIIHPFSQELIKADLFTAIPPGHYVRIAGR